MRKYILPLSVFTLSLLLASCTPHQLTSWSEEEEGAARPLRKQDKVATRAVTDILSPLGSLAGYSNGRWTMMHFSLGIHETLPDPVKRTAFMIEADAQNNKWGRHREILSSLELDTLIHAIDQVLGKAAKMKAEETEEMHMRVDIKKGLWIGFRQRNHEQEAYLNLNALGSDALLQFDIADLHKLKTMATTAAEKLRVMNTKEADYPAMEAAIPGHRSLHRR